MTTGKPTPLHERNWVKSLVIIVTILAGIAAITPIFRETRVALNASYRQAQFAIPDRFQHKTKADTAIAARNKLIKSLYDSLSAHLTFKEWRAFPDSLRPSSLPSYYSELNPVSDFAITYSGFCVLIIENTGEKGLSLLQIVHKTKLYYEYKDSKGQVHAGVSVGKFPIGELDGSEQREVYLWTHGPSSIGSEGLTIVYPEGKVTAEQPVEVTGVTAWVISNWFKYLWLVPMIGVIYSAIQHFRSKAQQ